MGLLTLPIPIFRYEYHTDTDTDFLKNTDIPIPIPIIPIIGLTLHKLDQSEAWKVGAIQEILQAKEGLAQIPGFEDDELDFILNYLCTD